MIRAGGAVAIGDALETYLASETVAGDGPSGPTGPQPSEYGLDVWLVPSPAPREAAALDLALLSASELERAASFSRPVDALLYSASHIALRRLLGARLGIPAAAVPFTREPCPTCGGPHGRPAVADVAHLHFSLAHTRGLALVALAATPVGVDVERMPRVQTVARCLPALHPDERAEIEAAPPKTRRQAFAQLWTRKEAYLKGVGTGLSRSPAKDYLGSAQAGRPPGWSVLDVPAGPTHRAAVAIRGGHPASIAVRRLPSHGLSHR